MARGLSKPPIPHLIAGIDGGGTKTLACLAWDRSMPGRPADIEHLGRGLAGPSNPNAHGARAGAEQIACAVRVAFDDAGMEPQPVASMAACIAGTADLTLRLGLKRCLEERDLADRLAVTDDHSPIWRAGQEYALTQGGPPIHTGVVLISGTGSIAWGQGAQGTTARAGGLGRASGDPGSGYAIGRAAVQNCACGQDNKLLDHLLQSSGFTDRETMQQWALDPKTPTADIARLAATAIAHHTRSPLARRLIDTAAADLAGLVIAVLKQLGHKHSDPYTLITAGGVLCRTDIVRDNLSAQLAQRACSPTQTIVISEPVHGAVLLAHDAR